MSFKAYLTALSVGASALIGVSQAASAKDIVLGSAKPSNRSDLGSPRQGVF